MKETSSQSSHDYHILQDIHRLGHISPLKQNKEIGFSSPMEKNSTAFHVSPVKITPFVSFASTFLLVHRMKYFLA